MSDGVGLIETWHALSAGERDAEQALLASMGRRFAGTRREGYDAMTAETPMADGVVLERVDQAGVQGWWVRPAKAPADRAILFLHGGAYMLGTSEAYRGLASQVAARSCVATFVADYPLAPEHPFPAAYEAAVAVRRWLGSQELSQIALVGDSAGGGLALATLGEPVAGSPVVAAAVVFSPWTDLALTGPSFTSPDTHDPIFKREAVANAAAAYLGNADAKDGRASPLYRIPDGLPPLAIQVGSDELLLDDARRYATLAARKGGEVRLDVFEGLHHVFQRRTEDLSSARLALDAAAEFLSSRWRQASS